MIVIEPTIGYVSCHINEPSILFNKFYYVIFIRSPNGFGFHVNHKKLKSLRVLRSKSRISHPGRDSHQLEPSSRFFKCHKTDHRLFCFSPSHARPHVAFRIYLGIQPKQESKIRSSGFDRNKNQREHKYLFDYRIDLIMYIVLTLT